MLKKKGEKKEETLPIYEYIPKGVYAIIRKLPHLAESLGYKNIWEIKMNQFNWALNSLSEEFKSEDKPLLDDKSSMGKKMRFG